MTAEHITLVLNIILVLATGGLGYLVEHNRRVTNVKLAEMETRRIQTEAAKDDSARNDANLTMGLALAKQLVVTFEPLRSSIDNLGKLVDRLMTTSTDNLKAVMDKADEMHLVVERRDQEATADRQLHTDRHGELLDQLKRQQKLLEELTKQIKVRDVPPEVRGDIQRLLLLTTSMGEDMKVLLRGQEPGEAAPQTPEPQGTGES